MKNEINGKAARQSGDINLVAAIMAMGVPLDFVNPLNIIEPEHGQPYTSYRLCESSPDGSELTERLLEAWSGSITLPPDHGFISICRFIKSRPRGIQRSDDLMDFAVDYLTERGHRLTGLHSFDDIPAFVGGLPNSESSYILAYVWNRDLCFQLHKRSARKTYMTEGTGSDARHAMIDTALPRWQVNELLSRLQG
jgi:hypothetical protein